MAKTLEDYRQESLAKMKRQKSMDAAGKRLAERKSTGVSGKVDRSTPLDRMKARNKGKTVEGSLASLKAKPAAPAPAPTSALDRMKARNKGKTVEGSLASLKAKPAPSKAKPASGDPLADMRKAVGDMRTRQADARAKQAKVDEAFSTLKKTMNAPIGRAPAKSSSPVKTVSTKGGNYPVYKKSSAEGKGFAAEFAAKRKAGEKEFTWQGRKYSTKMKGE